jgi:outer membrane lipopolysaccharide assembly protein LptE/RlpB
MRKLLTTLAASAALALYASAGQACDFHDMQSTSMPTESVVAMSTPDTSAPTPTVMQDTAAQQAAATACPADAKDCVPAKK